MPEASAPPLLSVTDLHAWHGESHILHGVEFEVRPGEVILMTLQGGRGTVFGPVVGALFVVTLENYLA